MGLVKKFIDNRVKTVLEELNITSNNEYAFMFDERFQELQNKVLFLGDTNEILRFYKTKRDSKNLYTKNYFYQVVTGNIPVLHYSLPTIISKTMANLVFSNVPRIEAFTGNKSLDKKLNKKVLDIYNDNSFGALLQKAAEMESYSGSVAFKISLDKDISEYPIITCYPKEDISVLKKYDRTTEVIFKDYYKKDKTDYILYTICGIGYIDYELYKSKDKKLQEVPLTEIEETSGLKRLEFYNKDGSKYKHLMCVYKENKGNGESDYKNLYDDFAALDEIYSNLIDFIRKSKIKTYTPESMLEQDMRSGKKTIKRAYDSDEIILYDSNPEGTKQEVKRDVIDVNNSIQGYQTAFNNTLLNALSSAGLSPATVGLDISGANSSALALNIRERTSLRTRSEKQKRWNETLQDLTKLVLSYMSIYNIVDNSVFLDAYDKDISVKFAEYESPSYQEQVQTLTSALDGNLISLSEALKILYPDKDPEELEIMKMEIEGQLPDDEDILNTELETEENDILSQNEI